MYSYCLHNATKVANFFLKNMPICKHNKNVNKSLYTNDK